MADHTDTRGGAGAKAQTGVLDMTLRQLLGASVRTLGAAHQGVVAGLWVEWDVDQEDTGASAVHTAAGAGQGPAAATRSCVTDPSILRLCSAKHVTDVLQQRYGTPLTQEASTELCGCKMPGLDRVRTLVLARNAIASTLGPWSSTMACPRLTDLDVSSNSFHGFRHALALLRNLPSLAFLALSHNDLHMSPADRAACGRERYPRLRTLVLNETRLPWHDIAHIVRLFPGIKELSLVGNR